MKKQEIENNQIEIPTAKDQIDDATIWQQIEDNADELRVNCLICSRLFTVKKELTKKRSAITVMKQRQKCHANTPNHLDLLKKKLQKTADK